MINHRSGQTFFGAAPPALTEIERLNNTLRQRVARLVRKTLSFSKKLENHIGAIWLFIHDYNRSLREKLAQQGHPLFSSGLH